MMPDLLFLSSYRDWVTRIQKFRLENLLNGQNKNLYLFLNVLYAPLMRCRHCYFSRGLDVNIWEK